MQWLKDKSWINKYIFPVPKPPRYEAGSFPNHMLYIPASKSAPHTLAANFFRVPGNKLVIYSHGNYEDIGENFDDMEFLSAKLQINFIVYDYTGYGINSGTPTESNLNSDIRRVFEYVTKTLHFEPQNIILFGRSLGNGPTMDLAAELHKKNVAIGGVILMSPFTSVCNLVGEAFSTVGSYLIADRFNNLARVKQYSNPLFIIHGQKDNIINATQSQKLYEASISTLKFAHFPEEMTHNSIHTEHHIAIPASWFLSKIYPERQAIGKFVQISLPYSKPESPTMSNLLKASRGVSAAIMDNTLNLVTKKKHNNHFDTASLTTREGLQEYITNRMIMFSALLKYLYETAKAGGTVVDDVAFIYELFLIYEPFVNIYVEMTKLRVALPAGAAVFAKSVHMLQSAPVGLLHAQLCIGGLVYSWDQSANGEATETNFSHVTDKLETVRIPVRIFHVKKRWALLMLSEFNKDPSTSDPAKVAADIAKEFVDCYYNLFPDMAPLHALVQKWNTEHHYQAATQNCQDFLTEALVALKLQHFATPNLYYSEPLVTYIRNVHADPAAFTPSLYGKSESEFANAWRAPAANAPGTDYALMVAKHLLRNEGYCSAALISIHATLLKALVQKYKDTNNNSLFIVFPVSTK